MGYVMPCVHKNGQVILNGLESNFSLLSFQTITLSVIVGNIFLNLLFF